MGMIVKIKKLLWMFALFLIAFSVIALSGCGNSPPPGATLTIAAFGPVISTGTGTNPIKGQTYRVTVTDSGGNPLSGVSVNLQGIFTAGDGISFNGATGSVPTPPLLSSVTTGNFGIQDLLISAPTYTVRQLSPPNSNVSATALATGGTLTVGTYDYCVTAFDVVGGETLCSSLVSATTATVISSVTIAWDAVSGAANYGVYGRTSGTLRLMNTTALLTFTDSGVSLSSTPTPTINTTGIAVNSVRGTVMGTTGPLSRSVAVAF